MTAEVLVNLRWTPRNANRRQAPPGEFLIRVLRS